jgi:hypothetical protein
LKQFACACGEFRPSAITLRQRQTVTGYICIMCDRSRKALDDKCPGQDCEIWALKKDEELGFFVCGNCDAAPDAPRGVCTACGATGAPIEQHHIDGVAVSDRTEPLCINCHRAHHKGRAVEPGAHVPPDGEVLPDGDILF